MRSPEFTDEQMSWICYKIGEWYLVWKSKITDDGNSHRLGIAKEQLKDILFPEVCGNCKENSVLWKGAKVCKSCCDNFGTDKFNHKKQ